MKTLLSVRAEKSKVFDGSTKGSPIHVIGDVVSSKTENMFKVKKGYLEVGLPLALGKNNSFTLEATIKPDNVIGARQNIMEAQSPPVAFFIDENGYLNGSVNIETQGWKSVKSSNPLQAGKSSHIVFVRDEKGNLTLEIDGKDAGSASFTGDLTSVGTNGFKIGTWVDGKTYQFKGEIGNINIKAGAFTSKNLANRIKLAKNIESLLKTKLGPFAHVFVNPSLDESHARLQPIK